MQKNLVDKSSHTSAWHDHIGSYVWECGQVIGFHRRDWKFSNLLDDRKPSCTLHAAGYDTSIESVTMHCITRSAKIAYNWIEIMCCVDSVGKHVRISHIASRRKLNHRKIKRTEQNKKIEGTHRRKSMCGKLSLLVSRCSVRRNNVIKAVFSFWSIKRISSIWREAMAAADRHNQFHRDAMCRNMKRIPDILLSLNSVAAATSCGLSLRKEYFHTSLYSFRAAGFLAV